MNSEAKKVFMRIGFALVAQMAVSILVSMLIFSPMNDPEKMRAFVDSVGKSVALITMYLPRLAGVIAVWLVVRGMPQFTENRENLGVGNIFQIFMIMYAVSSVFNFVGLSISEASPAGGSSALDQIGSLVGSGNITGILIITVASPVFEEIVYRKFILDHTRAYGETNAIIFSALSFGLFHENLTQFLFAFSVGLFLGYVYCRTGKVIITMIMHAITNGLGSVVMLLLPRLENGGDENTGIVLALLAAILVILIMMISGFVFLYRWIKQKRFHPDNSMPTCIPQNEVVKTIYLNPGVILFYTLCIIAIVMDLFNIEMPSF